MSENAAHVKYSNNKFRLSPSELTRPPLQRTNKEEEEDSFDEEIDLNFSNEVYPGEQIKEELKEIKKKNVQKQSERRQKIASTQIFDRPNYVPESTSFSSKPNNSRSLILIILSIVISVFVYLLYQSEKPAADKTILLTEFIADVQNKFEGQHHQTFHILTTSLKRVYNENSKPHAPSVITILTNEGAENAASDFSTYIAEKLVSENYILINEPSMHRNPDDLKYDIDTKIKSKFDNRSLNVAVIDKFHNIPIGAAMIFHSYCDHENAPFKRAIFLFIVHLNRKIPENSSIKTIDDAAMETLRSIWHDASDDLVDSLITRLTGYVINIK